jgi:hypothetical protein
MKETEREKENIWNRQSENEEVNLDVRRIDSLERQLTTALIVSS